MNLQKNIRSDTGRLLLLVLPHHRWLGQAHGACYTANIQTELLLWPGRLWLSSGSISVCWCCNSSQIHSPSLSNPYNSVVYLCINAWRWIGYSSQLRPIFLFCPRARFFPFTPFVQAGGRGAAPPPLYHSSCSLPKCRSLPDFRLNYFKGQNYTNKFDTCMSCMMKIQSVRNKLSTFSCTRVLLLFTWLYVLPYMVFEFKI